MLVFLKRVLLILEEDIGFVLKVKKEPGDWHWGWSVREWNFSLFGGRSLGLKVMRGVIEMYYKRLGELNAIKFHTKGN